MALNVMVRKIRSPKTEVKKKNNQIFYLHVLMGLAMLRYGQNISPCRNISWIDCIDSWKGRVYLWFNTPDQSTHIVSVLRNR